MIQGQLNYELEKDVLSSRRLNKFISQFKSSSKWTTRADKAKAIRERMPCFKDFCQIVSYPVKLATYPI